MTHLNTEFDTVEKVWAWCQDSFKKHKVNISFPKDTDRTKTYQWRYASRLVRRIEEWEFDDNTARAFIDAVVGYARDNHLLRKGLAAFFQGNVLQICYDRLGEREEIVDAKATRLAESKRFVDAHSGGESIVEVLVGRNSTRFNIVEWYEIDKISKLYLATSRACTVALARLKKLDDGQRELLPTASELLSLCSDVSTDQSFSRKLALILGSDWRKVCLQR
jgi:hypothetical protein